MKIALINGSPRGRKAVSEWILNRVEKNLKGNEIKHFYFTGEVTEQEISGISEFEQLVIAFPNYYASVPAHVLKNMELIEKLATKESTKKVYVIVNCGFYYSQENRMALRVMKNWCIKCGFTWSKGVAIGTGGCCMVIDKIPLIRVTLLPIYRRLRNLSALILNKNIYSKSKKWKNDWYVQAYIPCRLYVFIAERIWCSMAKKNGLKSCDL